MIKDPVPCRCGKTPEKNTTLRGYTHSLSCKCGGNEINFVSRSDNLQKLLDNWESLIKLIPYKHSVQHLSKPESDPQMSVSAFDDDHYDTDPLRRYIRATGGHCSGGGGCC